MFAGLRAWFVVIVLCLTLSTPLQFIVVVVNMPHVSMHTQLFWYFTVIGHQSDEFYEILIML